MFTLFQLFIVKYTVYKMGRIIRHKHFDNISSITADKFADKGEIIISNDEGVEGIFIINTKGELVFLSPSNSGGGGGGGTSSNHVFLSSEEYQVLLNEGRVEVNGELITYNDDTYYAIYESVEEEYITLSQGETLISAISSESIVNIEILGSKDGNKWVAYANEDWISVSPDFSNDYKTVVSIKINSNLSSIDRESTLYFRFENESVTDKKSLSIKIIQKGEISES